MTARWQRSRRRSRHQSRAREAGREPRGVGLGRTSGHRTSPTPRASAGELGCCDGVDVASRSERAERATQVMWRDMPKSGRSRSRLNASAGDVPLLQRRAAQRAEHVVTPAPSVRSQSHPRSAPAREASLSLSWEPL